MRNTMTRVRGGATALVMLLPTLVQSVPLVAQSQASDTTPTSVPYRSPQLALAAPARGETLPHDKPSIVLRYALGEPDDFEHTFETTAGNVNVLAQAVSEGGTLTLNNFMVYPENAAELEVGVAEMRAGFQGIVDIAKSAGYDQLVVNFDRLSGANVGKVGQQVVDLTK